MTRSDFLAATRRRTPLGIAAVVLTIGVIYADVIASLVRQWASDDNYSHGFFVVPLALYFGWERRARLQRAVLQPHWAGAILIAASLGIYLTGVLGAELFLTRVSLVGVIAGAVVFLFGCHHARILALPIGFLLLMIPLPAIVFNQLMLPLQLLASQLGEGVIAAAGVPVLREGNILHLPGRSLELVEACSGIRSLTSLLMLGVVLAYFTEQRFLPRVAIVVSAVPLAIVANAARVAGTGLAGEWISPEAADGFFHTFSGWLMFVVATCGLLAIQHAISHLPVGTARPRATAEPA